jgi:UDP-glucose:O-linked fucose beta-1,3-glucosyltransferase
MIQNNIYRDNDRIDALRTELKLEQSELEEWIRVNNEKEEDNMALMKYTEEDSAKIKELSLQIEKLIQEVRKKKHQLSTEVTETQVSQIELDHTAEAFKALHKERQDVLSSWENVVDKMKKRDEDIQKQQDLLQEHIVIILLCLIFSCSERGALGRNQSKTSQIRRKTSVSRFTKCK